MIELNGVRIWAIPYVDRRATEPRKLPCGVIVDEPSADQRRQASGPFPDRFEIPQRPGVFVKFTGVFQLGTGEVAAIYGAVPEKLG